MGAILGTKPQGVGVLELFRSNSPETSTETVAEGESMDRREFLAGSLVAAVSPPITLSQPLMFSDVFAR
jgi:hypothetical protein